MSLLATHKISDQIRKELGDPGSEAFTDAEYRDFIEGHLGDDCTITLTKSTSGIYKYCEASWPLYLTSFPVDPAFLGSGVTENDFEYRLNEYTMIYEPFSTDTRSTITVTGIEIDFPEIMVEIYRALASDSARACHIMAGVDTTLVSKEMVRLALQWRGVTAL